MKPMNKAALLVAVILHSSGAAAVTLTPIAAFNLVNGQNPAGGLVFDAAGNLFGATPEGGPSNDAGVVYRLSGATTPTPTLGTIATFAGPNGRAPGFGVVADATGNLYGSTSAGGANGFGSLFRVSGAATATPSFSKIFDFDGSNGNDPNDILLGGADTLFGATRLGGANNFGTLFKLSGINTASPTLTTLYSFTAAADGRNPRSLVADGQGNLFGAAGGGSGSLFRLSDINGATPTFTALFNFSGANGSAPRGLIIDASGNLFGQNLVGGTNGLGTVFKLSDIHGASPTLTTLASFGGSNGARPVGDLLADAGGNLFGVTRDGGADDLGTVFRITGVDTATPTLTTLFEFDGGNAGFGPNGGLIADGAGNLYGTAADGGSGFSGTIFRITDAGFIVGGAMPEPASWALLVAGFGLTGAVARRRRRGAFPAWV